MKHMGFRHHQEQGMVIVTILGMIMVGLVLMMGFMKLSSRMNQSALQATSQVQTDIYSDALANRIRNALLKDVQSSMASNQNLEDLRYETFDNGKGLRTLSAGRELSIILESSETILSVRCIGQGPQPNGSCTNDATLPKIYDIAVQSADPSSGTISVTQAEFQIEQAGLSSYAFFIKNEPQPSINLGPAVFSGIFGINFAQPGSGDTTPRTIRFSPGENEIVFQNVFMTNLSNPQQGLIFPDDSRPRVNFQKGVVSSVEAISFSELDALHGILKSDEVRTVNLDEIKNQADPLCSKVAFNANGSLIYSEFPVKDCTGATNWTETYSPTANQAIYARGQTVLLEASDTQGKTQVGNIAIVADGNVELGSSIVRDPNQEALTGFPVIMTTGNLVIPPTMKTLPNSQASGQNLGSITNSITAFENPTIQLDLSYISIRSAANNMGGSLYFSEALRNAASPGEAINLGKAVFNGLFISEKTPLSRTVFTNSPNIDGFGQVAWQYPQALSAIQTDWFLTQLGGGALRATVTRYDKQTINTAQALQSYPSVMVVGVPKDPPAVLD